MKWITRRNLHIDRTACPWLIRRAIDADAVFAFVAPDADPATLDGHTLRHARRGIQPRGGMCTFEVMLERYNNDDRHRWRVAHHPRGSSHRAGRAA